MINYDELKDKADIAQVAERIIGPATGQVSDQITFDCPRHKSGSHKSFHVSRQKQVFLCRACNVGGDVVTMVEFVRFGKTGTDLDKESRKAALQELAEISGYQLEPLTAEQQEQQEEKTKVFSWLTKLSDFWHKNLLERPDVIEWIQGQWGFDLESIKKANIGYADEKSGARPVNETSLKLGAYIPKKYENKGKEMHPFFQGRVIFPYMERALCKYAIGRKTPWTPDNKWEAGKYKKLLTHSEHHPYVSPFIRNDLLFNMPSVTGAERVIITEGIADCVALMLREIPAISPVTTSLKNNTYQEAANKLRGKDVIIINDTDEGGRRGAKRTLEQLAKYGIHARMGILPSEGGKVDVCSFFQNGGTVEQIDEICKTAKSLTRIKIQELNPDDTPAYRQELSDLLHEVKALAPIEREGYISEISEKIGVSQSAIIETLEEADVSSAPAKKKAEPLKAPEDGENPRDKYNPYKDTEFGNAERFARLCHKKALYVKNLGWHVWDGKRWLFDETKITGVYISSVIQEIYDEASEAAKNNENDKTVALIKWAKRSEGSANIQACLKIASSLPEFYISDVEKMNADPMLFNCQNGTIDLRTGKMKTHDPDDFISVVSKIEYKPGAPAYLWKSFLTEVLSSDSDLIEYLQKAAGYTLTGLTSEQCCFFCYGLGANGKSVFLNTLLHIIGDYGTQTAPDLLVQSKNGMPKHPTEQADLYGKRLAVSQEIEQGRRLAENTIKQITGSDRIKARFMRKDFFEFDATHKIWFACNHRPVVHDTTNSMWRRIKILPFIVQIAPDKQDVHLQQKLKDEAPGILNWLVEGCMKYQKMGLKDHSKINEATNEYKDVSDPLAQFFEAKCIIDKNNRNLTATAAGLFLEYSGYSEEEGDRPISKRAFGELLVSAGFMRVRGTGGVRLYAGIALKEIGPVPVQKERRVNQTIEKAFEKGKDNEFEYEA